MEQHPDSEPPRSRPPTRADVERDAAATVTVSWDRDRSTLVAFVWRRRRWRVERVERSWVIETGWWTDEAHVSRYYSRVLAEGRWFDLCFDRIHQRWFVDKVVS